MKRTTTWNGLHPRLCLNSSRKHVLRPLHIVMLREVRERGLEIRGTPRHCALCSLTNQVLELHRLDEIGVSHQVLSTQFTSLYFVMMSCNTASDVSLASPAMCTTPHTSLLPSRGTSTSQRTASSLTSRLALVSHPRVKPNGRLAGNISLLARGFART